MNGKIGYFPTNYTKLLSGIPKEEKEEKMEFEEKQKKNKRQGDEKYKWNVVSLQVISLLTFTVPSLASSKWLDHFVSFFFPPGFTLHEFLDFLFTVLLVLQLFYNLELVLRKNKIGFSECFFFRLLFVFFAVLMVEGHGAHNAANAIDNMIKKQTDLGKHFKSTPLYSLVYYFDEHFGHFYWLAGDSFILLLICYVECLKGEARPESAPSSFRALHLSLSVLNGIVWFVGFVEGQCVLLGFVIIALAFAIKIVSRVKSENERRSKEKEENFFMLDFMFVGLLVMYVGMILWGLYFRGFPEFDVLQLGNFKEWPRHLWQVIKQK